jgi:hypothetical protein
MIIKTEHHHAILGVLLIVVGLASYILPIPGSTFLVVLGLVWIFGRRKVTHLFKKLKAKISL